MAHRLVEGAHDGGDEDVAGEVRWWQAPQGPLGSWKHSSNRGGKVIITLLYALRHGLPRVAWFSLGSEFHVDPDEILMSLCGGFGCVGSAIIHRNKIGKIGGKFILQLGWNGSV